MPKSKERQARCLKLIEEGVPWPFEVICWRKVQWTLSHFVAFFILKRINLVCFNKMNYIRNTKLLRTVVHSKHSKFAGVIRQRQRRHKGGPKTCLLFVSWNSNIADIYVLPHCLMKFLRVFGKSLYFSFTLGYLEK